MRACARPVAGVGNALIFALLAAMPLCGQAMPMVVPFPGERDYVLAKTYRFPFSSKSGEIWINVPVGFVTDFASIPDFIKPTLDKIPHTVPGLVHDYLYWRGECSQKEADHIFDLALQQVGTSPLESKVLWEAVDKFGEKAYAENHKYRTDGYPRIIPERYIEAIPLNTEWDKYRKQLHDRGIVVDSLGSRPTYCKG
jgi:hypothetical protein